MSMKIRELRKENMRRFLDERGISYNSLKAADGIDGNYLNRVMRDPSKELSDQLIEKFTSRYNLAKDFFDIERARHVERESMFVPLLDKATDYSRYMEGLLKRRDMELMAVDESVFSSTTFAVPLEGDAMKGGSDPLINGDKLVIDPDIKPEHGDVVFAKISDTDSYVFRIYVEESGSVVLRPANPSYPVIPIQPDDRVIGVVKSFHRISSRFRNI